MSKRSGLVGALAMALMLVASGCGRRGLVAVQGVVTLDGAPVEDASVTFSPEWEGGKAAGGVTDSDGVFELTTFSEGDGAMPGAYRVTVSKIEYDRTAALKLTRKRNLKSLLSFKRSQSNQLPAVYSNHSTTPLRWRVPTDGKKTLELSSKGASSP